MEAEDYFNWREKGPIVGGKRITILTASTMVHPGDEVRIFHVAEFVEPGYRVYIGGPKPVFGEYMNDKLSTGEVPGGDPLVPLEYAGVILPSPAVDYNYDVTSYIFQEPGIYRIQWRPGLLQSNILLITVMPFSN